jgi:hypothetical protein
VLNKKTKKKREMFLLVLVLMIMWIGWAANCCCKRGSETEKRAPTPRTPLPVSRIVSKAASLEQTLDQGFTGTARRKEEKLGGLDSAFE